ncbi:MAG: DUF4294 domain-containing protein [Prevotellaceae bacterium]|jgi:hypothetical protein|nr:DUF4294 domain-containing protein [Prevotellaceae bacterium]
MKTFCINVFVLLMSMIAAASTRVDGVVLARMAIDEHGDTIPHIVLRPVYKFAKPIFKNAKAERKYYASYSRMAYNLKKVYPYSKIIKHKLAEMDAEYATIKTEKERKAYIKQVEKELFAEFEKPLRGLTISQGRILIKLVDRETGRTGYQIIKELKGGVSAFFWQAVAVMFSSSLKMEFNAEGDDKMLNELIILYENGLL